MLNNATGKYDFDKSFAYHSDFVYSVCAAVDNSGFFSGGKDKMIYKIDLSGNPVM